MALKITNQQHKNILNFLSGSYPASINPPSDVEVLILTAGFDVCKAYYIGLNEYQVTGIAPDDSKIIAWKHI